MRVLASHPFASANHGRYCVIRAARSSSPASTSDIAVAATIILLIEAARKSVAVVTGALLVMFFVPTPAANASLPWSTTATLAPGAPLFARMLCVSARSSFHAAVSCALGPASLASTPSSITSASPPASEVSPPGPHASTSETSAAAPRTLPPRRTMMRS